MEFAEFGVSLRDLATAVIACCLVMITMSLQYWVAWKSGESLKDREEYFKSIQQRFDSRVAEYEELRELFELSEERGIEHHELLRLRRADKMLHEYGAIHRMPDCQAKAVRLREARAKLLKFTELKDSHDQDRGDASNQ
ncbi:hypothetical protein [Paraferrimonas sedimenticola]|uniref:Uncharacterized protein n=1 Tax=Paraferrimonas sedimenticola TaxID=375674 RepID=A0AA37VXL6_9GAMM|nr:hypothetical protein [Paraferrimonas sedimenticola]GLP95320.1 hypothetical protein GCM10007895_06260 [Paraferrimonas sedimenticola]